MFAFAYLLVSSLLLFSPAYGSPLVTRSRDLIPLPLSPKGILCNIPIPIVKKLLCPRQANGALTVSTPIGTAHGANDGSAVRFPVRYASASRWQESSLANTWALPSGVSDPTGIPLACPQDNINGAFSEDCLSMVLYVPSSVTPNSNVPILLWIHGGSFTMGGISSPGLDGSNLAVATNSIVVVIQYRLGVLGFNPPSGNTNLAVKDAINAIKFVRKVAPSFGGDITKLTLAGQSAGATMIRTLLGTPSSSSLFAQAILQSDTLDYGLYSSSMQSTLQSHFNGLISCSPSDTSCLNGLSVTTILNAQDTLSGDAPGLVPAANLAEPIRPVRDGSLVTSPLDSTASFPSVNKPILISTVFNEAGSTIYGQFNQGLDPDTYEWIVSATFGDSASSILLGNALYAVPQADQSNDSGDVTPQLQQMGTDQVWRCPAYTFARNLVGSMGGSGKTWIAEYRVGATYPGNEQVAFCTQSGVVCHQDDIMIVFGTVASPTPAQAALTTEMQARYKSFLRTGNPNAPGFATWSPATTDAVHAIQLGASGDAAIGACTLALWGNSVPFDYQVFGI